DKIIWKDLSKKTRKDILEGSFEKIDLKLKYADITKTYKIDFEGIIPYLDRVINDKENPSSRSLSRRYSVQKNCPTCDGQRLRTDSLYFKINDKNIADVSTMDFRALKLWLDELPKSLTNKQKKI